MAKPTYFAYGSNLNEADCRRWCAANNQPYPFAAVLGRVWLPDYQLLFDYYSSVRQGGALNVTPRRGYAVPGILFELTDSGQATVSRKERAPDFYQAQEVIVLDSRGREVKTLTYVAAPHRRQQTHVPPQPAYQDTVLRGLQDHGIDPAPFLSACQGLQAESALPLFVYGTLMQGGCNHHLLRSWSDREPIKGSVSGLLYDLGTYPGLRLPPGPDRPQVQGELYPVQGDRQIQLKEIDRLEGFHGYGHAGSLYSRIIREVTTSSTTCPAWLYVLLGQPEAPLIPAGQWLGSSS